MIEARASRSGAAAAGPHSRFAFWALLAWLAITLMWWALAFAPLPAPPVWLAEAREVCFGTLPSGLPEPWGWGSLIVTPLAMLGFLLAVWGRDVARDLRVLAHGTGGRVVLSLMVTLPLLGAGWVADRVARARSLERALIGEVRTDSLPETYPRGVADAPALDLIDQHGERFDLQDATGRPVLLTFAFAHCRTVCPIVVDTVRTASRQVDDLSPVVVVVTLDPWRDTPASLPDLARGWKLDEGGSAYVLSGAVEDVTAVLEGWEMPFDRNLTNGDITHPAIVHVVDPNGRLAYSFQNPPASWVAEAARRVAVDAASTESATIGADRVSSGRLSDAPSRRPIDKRPPSRRAEELPAGAR